MTLTVVVHSSVVGKNQARGYKVNPETMKVRVYVTTEMKHWQRKVAVAAWVAGVHGGWPDPFSVKLASVHIQRYNMGGDFDRGNEYLFDALQVQRWPTPRGESALPGAVGLVGNDRDLYSDGSPPTITDEKGQRVVLTIKLHALYAPDETAKLRERWERKTARREAKRKAKSRARSTRGEEREIESRLGMELF